MTGSPKFNTPNGPPRCPECGEPIRYQERHREAGVWKHQACAQNASHHHLVQTVAELDVGPDGENHALAVVALMRMNSDVQRAARLAELNVSFVEAVKASLEENSILEDGIWKVDPDVDLDDGQHCAIQVMLWIMCVQGLVRRVPGGGDQADPGVP
jgi:hypothetical protein